MIPFEIMAIVTILWTLVAAFLIAPAMVWNKIKKHNATPEDIKKDVTDHVDQSLKDLEIPEFPDPQDFTESMKTELIATVEELQTNMPTIIDNYFTSKEGQEIMLTLIKAGSKSVSGAIYSELGVDEKKLKKGVSDAKEWIVDQIDQVQDNPMFKIARRMFVHLGYDEEDVNEKIGAIRTLAAEIKEWQQGSKGGSQTSFPGPRSSGSRGPTSGGSELDTYYR